jgi:hypothetical protein
LIIFNFRINFSGPCGVNVERFPRLSILQQHLGQQISEVSEPIGTAKTICDWITAALKWLFTKIGAKIEEFGDYVKDKGTEAGKWMESKGDGIKDVGNKTKDFGTVLQSVGNPIVGTIVNGVGYGIQGAGIAVKAVGGKIRVASEAIGGAIKSVGGFFKSLFA